MAFVFKNFTEADQAKYDSLHLTNPLNTFKYPDYWTIDEERDAIMVSFGGQGYRSDQDGPPDYYALVWHGKIIELEGYYSTTYPTKETKEIWYQKTRVVTPRALKNEMNIVHQLMCEAIQILEDNIGYNTKDVHIEFNKILYV